MSATKVSARCETTVDASRTRDFLAWLIEQSQRKAQPKLQVVEKPDTNRAA